MKKTCDSSGLPWAPPTFRILGLYSAGAGKSFGRPTICMYACLHFCLCYLSVQMRFHASLLLPTLVQNSTYCC